MSVLNETVDGDELVSVQKWPLFLPYAHYPKGHHDE